MASYDYFWENCRKALFLLNRDVTKNKNLLQSLRHKNYVYLLTIGGADDGATEHLPDASPDVLMVGEDEERDQD